MPTENRPMAPHPRMATLWPDKSWALVAKTALPKVPAGWRPPETFWIGRSARSPSPEPPRIPQTPRPWRCRGFGSKGNMWAWPVRHWKHIPAGDVALRGDVVSPPSPGSPPLPRPRRFRKTRGPGSMGTDSLGAPVVPIPDVEIRPADAGRLDSDQDLVPRQFPGRGTSTTSKPFPGRILRTANHSLRHDGSRSL